MTRGVCAGLVAAGVLTACSSSPAAFGPTGVDELTIPTPSPDQADFTGRVDNPWFPLAPGTRWTYRRYTVSGSQVLVATALARPHPVVGVATTAVRWQVHRPGGGVRTVAVRWYAEDLAGNVWWFGQRLAHTGIRVDELARRSWQAGRDGALAGLVVSAAPRLGDGYANGSVHGVVERRSTVTSLDATVAVPRRTYRDTLLLRDASGRTPTRTAQSFFARGVGLVEQQTTDSASSDLSLVRVRLP